eukprot:scaffold103678_cov15-Tisochrysis_lutea.AAC.1
MRKPKKSLPTPITAEGWRSYLQDHFGAHQQLFSYNWAAVHVHRMGSCPKSKQSQETAPRTTASGLQVESRYPSCPAGSNSHIPPQQLGPKVSCSESTSSTSEGIWASFSIGMEYFSRTVRGVAQRITARWTDGTPDRGVAVPLRCSNPPPELLMPQ